MSNLLLKTVYYDDSDLVSAVEDLLCKGEDPNEITEYNESPLRVASNNGRFDVIKVLLARGADESQLGWTSIFHAIAYGSTNDLKEMVASGSDFEAQDFWSRTPLLFSILVGDTTKTAILVDAGADVIAVGRCGKTPMAYAIQKDDVNMLSWLIDHGFDPEQVDEYSFTPLIIAAEQGATKCANMLIDRGVDIFKENHISEQAIAVASNFDIVKTLVKAGTDLNDVSNAHRRSATWIYTSLSLGY
jgi:ankyrin repeat protein